MPDPDEMNADPQPCFFRLQDVKWKLSETFEFSGIGRHMQGLL
jgi:hypothetical protein